MLGHFFAYFLKTGSNGGRLTILGATSGDTGSAAIAGLRGKPGVQCVILFPHGRVSDIQERQMTSVLDENIHCVAVDGTFDDCQDIVKASFDTPDFRDAVHLGAVNSINWCRVLAQTTYYVWTYLRLTTTNTNTTTDGNSGEIHFSVPTGNFGDILAGYYAKRMGLTRIGKLIVATNENDILHRFFTKGEYHREKIQATISPSMDICVSSNFERYLYHLASDDSNILNGWMNAFEATGQLTIDGALLRRAQDDFDAARADTKATLQTIREYYETDGYILCPHSAVGVAAIHQLGLVQPHTVCLATAHAGKFPDAVRSVVPPEASITPPALAALATLPTRRTELPNDAKAVQAFVRNVVAKDEKQKRQMRQITMAGVAGTAVVIAAVVVQVHFLKSRRR
jgi:threonine synthase